LVFAKAAELKCRPLVVIVLDPSGQTIAFMKQDGASIIGEAIVKGKAWSSVAFGMNSRDLENVFAKNPKYLSSFEIVAQGKLVPVPGGVIVKDKTGVTLGAVGAGGDSADRDEECVISAIKAAGFEVIQKSHA